MSTAYVGTVCLFLGIFLLPAIVYYLRLYWIERFDSFIKGRQPFLTLLWFSSILLHFFVIIPLRTIYTFILEQKQNNVLYLFELLVVIIVMTVGLLRFWHIVVNCEYQRHSAKQVWTGWFADDSNIAWYIKYDYARNIQITGSLFGGSAVIISSICITLYFVDGIKSAQLTMLGYSLLLCGLTLWIIYRLSPVHDTIYIREETVLHAFWLVGICITYVIITFIAPSLSTDDNYRIVGGLMLIVLPVLFDCLIIFTGTMWVLHQREIMRNTLIYMERRNTMAVAPSDAATTKLNIPPSSTNELRRSQSDNTRNYSKFFRKSHFFRRKTKNNDPEIENPPSDDVNMKAPPLATTQSAIDEPTDEPPQMNRHDGRSRLFTLAYRPPRLGPIDYTIFDVIADATGFEIFMNHLLSEYSMENLLYVVECFQLKCQLYKAYPQELNDEDLPELPPNLPASRLSVQFPLLGIRYLVLFEMYIDDGTYTNNRAEMQINIGGPRLHFCGHVYIMVAKFFGVELEVVTDTPEREELEPSALLEATPRAHDHNPFSTLKRAITPSHGAAPPTDAFTLGYPPQTRFRNLSASKVRPPKLAKAGNHNSTGVPEDGIVTSAEDKPTSHKSVVFSEEDNIEKVTTPKSGNPSIARALHLLNNESNTLGPNVVIKTVPGLSRAGSSSEFNGSEQRSSMHMVYLEGDDPRGNLPDDEPRLELPEEEEKNRETKISEPHAPLTQPVSSLGRDYSAYDKSIKSEDDEKKMGENDLKRNDTLPEDENNNNKDSAAYETLRQSNPNAPKKARRNPTLSSQHAISATSERKPPLVRSTSIYYTGKNARKKLSHKIMLNYLMGKHEKENLPAELVKRIWSAMDQSMHDVFANLRDSYSRFQQTTNFSKWVQTKESI